MKFRYSPGNYPTPMLAYYTEPNVNAFNESLETMVETYHLSPQYYEGEKHY